MSATQGAAIKEISSAIHPQENETEYLSLLERIKQVEHKFKLGNVDEELRTPEGAHAGWKFEAELKELTDLSRKHQERLLKEYASWYYKLLAIQAEAKEYFNTATAADRLDLYVLGQQLYAQLPKQVIGNSEENDETRTTLKNIIRVIIAGLEYLHSIGDFRNAVRYAQGLHDFVVNRGLATKKNPAFGTRAIIYHFLGRSLSQRGIDDDYQRAIDYFYQCSESYFEMARRRGNNEVDVIYARTRAMVSLAFGAGFLFYYAHSDLIRAKAQIAQARLAFLRDDGTICWQLHYHYLELLYASILRAEAGEITGAGPDDDKQAEAERALAREKLDRASEILDRCAKALENEPRYFARVLYNQALVYLFQGPNHYERVRQCIAELLREFQDNPRWLANGLILKSHLERRVGEFEVALGDALKAYNQAGNHLPVRVEALLARGQAQLGRHQLIAARADFEKALQLNNGANLKMTAMGHLLLVELAIAQQKPELAYESFAQVKALMSSIRHGFIINKFRQLETQMDNLQSDFVIPGSADDLDYKKLEMELQRWLLEKVVREDSNLTRAAQRLNVSKKTVYMWLCKYNIKT